MKTEPPLIAIVGPTGSGKTTLSLQIAQRFNGEIIAADSRTIYRGMDIGTAKPLDEERRLIRHHLIDVVEPSDRFTVADWKRRAEAAITDIRSRGKLPVVVGGSGLYVDALLYGFSLRRNEPEERAELDSLPLDELQQRAQAAGAELNDSDRRNRRRLIRALETGGEAAQKTQQPPPNTLIIGLDPGLELLSKAIAQRTAGYFRDSLEQEAKRLYSSYGEVEPLNTSPYREVKLLLEGAMSRPEVEALINLHLRQLAKRQLTWFRRNGDINWARNGAAGQELAAGWLANRL